MKERKIRLSGGKQKEKERRRTEECTYFIKSINKWMSYLRVPWWIEQNRTIEMFRWQMCQRASITRPIGFQGIVTNGALEQYRREQGVRKSFTPILPLCVESLRIPSYDLSSEPNPCPRWPAISPILFVLLHVVGYLVENHSTVGSVRSVAHECSHAFLSSTKHLVALQRWCLNTIKWKRRVSVIPSVPVIEHSSGIKKIIDCGSETVIRTGLSCRPVPCTVLYGSTERIFDFRSCPVRPVREKVRTPGQVRTKIFVLWCRFNDFFN